LLPCTAILHCCSVLPPCTAAHVLLPASPAGTHDILRPYDSDGMAAQLYFTADAPTSRFFRSWDLDLVFDVLQVRRTV
jgi:hypothetical protein